ncbi:hypothetical protein BVRB_005630 isoform B [Beta vulgaris subsp. vulgaris]|uniref:DOMON domain-containing protein n=1 Tax=Beta vulgaris subsp. vulgaris TaxID=3555 RepID=A0A0J8DXX0_BETVV|nr:hypothetical protein BVRB_005630 isoform B [Beta vulgaris subsp. vulgaris]
MASLLQISQLFSLLFLLTLSPSLSSTCTSPKLISSYQTCTQLSSLSSSLHFTYNRLNKSLSIAFTATPPSPSGWVAWGINPTSTGMAGTQAILGYRNSDGTMSVKTLNISSYSDLVEGKLSFDVSDKRAVFNSGDGSITIFATVQNPGDGKINHVWQVGPSVSKGFPDKHDFKPENLASKGSLDLNGSGQSGSSSSDTSSSNDATKKRNVGSFILVLGLVFGLFSYLGCS